MISNMSETQEATTRTPASRGARTRAAILDAAGTAFAADGYDGTTVAAVAATAGVSEAAVFGHYGSKDALLLAVMRRTYDDLVADADLALAGPGGPVARWRRLVDAYASRLERQADLVVVFASRARTTRSPLADEFEALNRTFTRRHLAAITAVADAGLLADGLTPTITRDAIFGTLEHTILAALQAGRPPSLRDVGDRLVTVLSVSPDPDDDRLAAVVARLDRIEARLS